MGENGVYFTTNFWINCLLYFMGIEFLCVNSCNAKYNSLKLYILANNKWAI